MNSMGALPKWTVLLYSAADNDMMRENIRNVIDLETVGSDADTHLVAQLDVGDSCSRYRLIQGARPDGNVASPALETTGPVNMSDPRTLSDFIQWGVRTFPAQHYMVIVSDHGEGWKGAVQDDSHGDWMSLAGLRQGFEDAQRATGRKVDIIGFDACLMASTEVAHELQGVCDFLVASQESEGGAGWPYSRILNHTMVSNLKQMQVQRINVGPRELAAQCVRDAATTQDELPTMSAIDMAKMPAVTAALDDTAAAILAPGAPLDVVCAAVAATQPFDEYRDLRDFAGRLDGLGEAPARLAAAVDEAIVAEQHAPKYTGAHGITIELSDTGVPEGYEDTRLAKETQWPQALRRLQQGSAGQP